MALVLDHINGVSERQPASRTCGSSARTAPRLWRRIAAAICRTSACARAAASASRRQHVRHRYCSQKCWGTVASELRRGRRTPRRRKVDRPSYKQLLADLESMSFVAVGRKYGVSDNAVRKWIRWYKHAGAAGGARLKGGLRLTGRAPEPDRPPTLAYPPATMSELEFLGALHVELLRRDGLRGELAHHRQHPQHELFQTSTVHALLAGAYEGDLDDRAAARARRPGPGDAERARRGADRGRR